MLNVIVGGPGNLLEKCSARLVVQNTTTGTTYQGVNGNGANVNAGFNAVLRAAIRTTSRSTEWM